MKNLNNLLFTSLLMISFCFISCTTEGSTKEQEGKEIEASESDTSKAVAENTTKVATEEVTVQKDEDLPTETYRSDQYTPGIISEYIKLTLSSDRQHIKKIEYWYIFNGAEDGEESKVYELKFRKNEQFEGEEVGNKGELMLPEDGVYIPFRKVEGIFEITHGHESIQVFEMEM